MRIHWHPRAGGTDIVCSALWECRNGISSFLSWLPLGHVYLIQQVAVSVCAQPSLPRLPFCLAQLPVSEELRFAGERMRQAGMQAQEEFNTPPYWFIHCPSSFQDPTK